MKSQFQTWKEVIAHVASGAETYYQAPLNVAPVRIAASVASPRSRKVSVRPWGYPLAYHHSKMPYDPFMADSGHLTRFYCER
jgi:hypothetical protein